MTGFKEAVTVAGDEEDAENRFVPGREISHSCLEIQIVCSKTIEVECRDCGYIVGQC